ncbi:hypothetical protein D7I46_01045 [Lactococcus allomyrinae]|uniref:Uncharacterized protein n=1 Tax=Lactococcus allomyrinae TaxID=2419773 RepID=A0A387BMN1_9LACT|nr:hypothetical protein D7I46_01045 [Lactococcus allomyrinae]
MKNLDLIKKRVVNNMENIEALCNHLENMTVTERKKLFERLSLYKKIIFLICLGLIILLMKRNKEVTK